MAEQPLTGCAACWDAEKTAVLLKHEIVLYRYGIETERYTVYRTRYNRHEENNIYSGVSVLTTIPIVGNYQKRDASSTIKCYVKTFLLYSMRTNLQVSF